MPEIATEKTMMMLASLILILAIFIIVWFVLAGGTPKQWFGAIQIFFAFLAARLIGSLSMILR